jgi:hypothetical protein
MEGDEAGIPDGVYVGYEGIVVIVEGRFQGNLKFKDKWDRDLESHEVLGRCPKLNLPYCVLLEDLFGEESLEFILKDYAPDLEFLGSTVSAMLDSHEANKRVTFGWKLVPVHEEIFSVDNSNGVVNRIYTNPETDNSFQLSFRETKFNNAV